ncbi:ABC transporter permease [Herbidospora cretacea]|uniref:ABC transporter permease n=1 Tax=Herbidospora cretacea TaxID=28444 RepID=UPI00077381B9|nr:ABC transporter permease [Herbidospora cretacea]
MNRLTWAFADGWTVTRREFTHWGANPGQLVAGLLFPVMVVLLFAYLLGGGIEVPDGGYREFLMPGMFAMTMVFGLEGTFTSIGNDVTKGVTDRFRSLPMASSAVVSGRAAADMLTTVLALAVLIASGLAIGWRAHNGLAGAAAAVGLLLWLRFALLWTGIWLGLKIRNPEAVMAIQILVWPIGFLSSAITSPATMPGWLGAIADWNPLSSTAAAARELFGNPGWPNDTWAAAHAVELALVWPLVITLVFAPLSVRAYRNLSR